MTESKAPAEGRYPEPELYKTNPRVTLALVLFAVLLYVPFAGSYGLWDPWETHYGEVARTMLQRNDFITTYWQDEVFKSKPVLTFWMQAAGMAAMGLNRDGSPAGEMALSSLPEWGMRLPFVLVSIFCLLAIYLLVARVVGRRAGVLSAIVCLTTPQYALISRQSITDIPFVALMSAALCFFLLGLYVGQDEEPAAYRVSLGSFRLEVTAWHLFSGVLLLLVVPQLLIMTLDIGWQHHRSISWGTSRLQLYGLPYVLPWLALLAFYLYSTFASGARKARHVYVHMAWMLCGLSVLAKGLGGLAIPVAVVGLFIVLMRDWRLLSRLEVLRGAAIFLLVAAPWHHAMWIRHGQAFWNEYFGHHHFKRAQLGVHGERGAFDYFVHQLGLGMFPWSALVPAAVVRWISHVHTEDRRSRLVAFAFLWAAVAFALFSLMETKFHHYALPVIPPLAILIGLWLDDVLESRRTATLVGVIAAVGLALILLRDLYKDPQHLVLMFIYKYNRLFPYELGFEPWIATLGGLCILALAALAIPSWRRYGVWGLLGCTTLFTLWTVDRYLVQLSPHWGQKNLHAIYHRARKGPHERLIAWQLNWRGENFYSKNQVVVHMQPKDTPKFKEYLTRHKGERFYLVMEQGRLASLKSILSQVGARESLELVGPGGKAWPDNWIGHFRVERTKILFRERASLTRRCQDYKSRLSAHSAPASAKKFVGSKMADNWWGGHCRKFVSALWQSLNKQCGGSAATMGRSDCQAGRDALRKKVALCRAAEQDLGPYPYRECFAQYPNNKFMLVRFVP
ncbi:MAG: glycosyltransferase family 39 protein [bacterium]